MKVSKQRKTCVVRTSLSISFNESFDFQVEDDLIPNSYFVIELRDNSMFNKKGINLICHLTNKRHLHKVLFIQGVFIEM